MTDKELLKQAYDALDKITDMFDAVNGRCVMGGDDIYDFAIQAMMQLDERLKQEQPKTNQCAETCERAKLCAVCGVGLSQEQKPVAWMYTNAQGKTVIVESDVAPYVDAVPLYSHCPPPKPMMAHAGIMIWCGNAKIVRIFSEGELAMARYQAGIIKTTVEQMLDKIIELKF